MKILICSAGRICSQLARTLIAQNHAVSVVENRPEVLALVHKELPRKLFLKAISLIRML